MACLTAHSSIGNWYTIEPALLAKAKKHAMSDSVGSGWCGRGVYSVLKKIGYAQNLKSADGHNWEENLKKAGWVSFFCEEPTDAPIGAILVYLSDVKVFGKNKIGTRGGKFGHVEMVVEKNGGKVFVSDTVREKPGGTVSHNFTRRYWIPEDVYLEGMGYSMMDSQEKLKENLMRQSIFLD